MAQADTEDQRCLGSDCGDSGRVCLLSRWELRHRLQLSPEWVEEPYRTAGGALRWGRVDSNLSRDGHPRLVALVHGKRRRKGARLGRKVSQLLSEAEDVDVVAGNSSQRYRGRRTCAVS